MKKYQICARLGAIGNLGALPLYADDWDEARVILKEKGLDKLGYTYGLCSVHVKDDHNWHFYTKDYAILMGAIQQNNSTCNKNEEFNRRLDVLAGMIRELRELI